MRVVFASVILLLVVSPAVAGYHHRHHGGLICGATQMAYFGIRDPAFRLARTWAERLPRTTAHPGAVVFQWRNGRDSAGHQGGHVSRIVQVLNTCSAVVSDERGTYTRDICRGATIVQPN